MITVLILSTLPVRHSIGFMINDKVAHFVAFYVCALLLDFSFPDSGFDLKKAVPLILYGLLIEIIQLYLSYRHFSLLDLLADAGGLMVYGLSLPIIKRLPFLKWRWAGAH
jgi:VanZ family protein